MNNLIKRGRAFVTAPLFGYETEMASGIPGELEAAIIDELKLKPEDFKLQEIPTMAFPWPEEGITSKCAATIRDPGR
jgi:tRNA pseudouridine13 synthase